MKKILKFIFILLLLILIISLIFKVFDLFLDNDNTFKIILDTEQIIF